MEYLACDNEKEKNKIFRERIEYPFMKLAENLIHTFKFYNFDYDSKTVQKEVVGFMVLNMHKFNPDKGKAFSYFSVITKNWFIHKVKKQQKRINPWRYSSCNGNNNKTCGREKIYTNKYIY